MSGILKGFRGQQGFSMAEMAMAMLVFTLSIVGISGMLIGGTANINLSAKEAKAINLAAQKIEEIKSLPFYKPWNGTALVPGTPQDIDDFYWADSGGETPTWLDNDQQEGHPHIDEPGGGYSLETYIEYIYTPEGTMEDPYPELVVPADMSANWVPKEPTVTQFDIPEAIVDGNNVLLHALRIQVTVKYMDGDTDRSYVTQGLAGDFVTSGGVTNLVLMAVSISPSYDSIDNPNAVTHVKVFAPGMKETDTVVVKLWYPPSLEVEGNVTDLIVPSDPDDPYREIIVTFDLTASNVRAGLYNLAVNWGGWSDQNLKECFTVDGEPPVISGLVNDGKGYDWGYYGQSSRVIAISGDYLNYPTGVALISPDNLRYQEGVVTWGIVGSDRDTLYAALKLDADEIIVEDLNEAWDIEVTTKDGMVSTEGLTDDKKLLMNPPPQVISIEGTEDADNPKLYRKKLYDTVKVHGKYLQWFNDVEGNYPRLSLSKEYCPPVQGENASTIEIKESAVSGECFTDAYVRMNLGLDPDGGLVEGQGIEGSGRELGDWTLNTTNKDFQSGNTKSIRVENAPMSISLVTTSEDGAGTGTCYNNWDVPTTITGKYFDTDASHLSFFFVDQDVGLTTSTVAVSGTYGGADPQSISGLKLNTIQLGVSTRDVVVNDTENGKTASKSYNVIAPPLDGTKIAVPALSATSTQPDGWPQQGAFSNNTTAPDSAWDYAGHPNEAKRNQSCTFSVICKKMKDGTGASGPKWEFQYTIYLGGVRVKLNVNSMAYSRQYRYVKATLAAFTPAFVNSAQHFRVRWTNMNDAADSHSSWTTPTPTLAPERIELVL